MEHIITEVVKMSSTAINYFSSYSTFTHTTNAKLAISYVAAHLTAISTIGVLYLLGLFDVGLLESFVAALPKPAH